MKGIIKKDNQFFQYQIIVKNNKNTYFRINDGKVLITTNRYTHQKEIIKILERDFDKIYHKISISLSNSNELYLWGKPYQVKVIKAQKFDYDISNEVITIYQDEKNSLESGIKKLYETELDKMIKKFEVELEERIKKFNLKLVNYKIKDVKSYYGKCFFKRKEMFFNLNLAKIEPKYLEYVMYHEYAHLVVFNHSKEFYQVLEALMPNYKEVKRELKKIII